MYIERITRRNGDKTKFMKYTLKSKIDWKFGSGRPMLNETLTNARARNAREYKRYFGRVLTYPGFGRGFTYLGAHKVFY